MGVVPIMPSSVVEGAGVLTNGAQLALGFSASSNITVNLQSSDPSSIALPTSVTILSGQSNQFFNVSVGDNLFADGNRVITITATTDFSTNTTTSLVVDDDPDHLVFSAIPFLVQTNVAFAIQITAANADGSIQTNFNKSITLTATALEGLLPLTPTNTDSFVQGQLSTYVQVTSVGHGVYLGSQQYRGVSAAFTVIVPPFYSSGQHVSDIVWLEGSQTLLASVPATSGPYSNCLVTIDPASGLVTNSYPVGYDPGQIEISPAGDFLYVALSNQTMLQRFSLATRSASAPFQLGTNQNSYRFAYTFSIPPGLPDSVVVAARLKDNIGNTSIDGFYRYDSGNAVALPSLTATGAYLVESMNTGNKIALSPPLQIADASTGAILAANGNAANGSYLTAWVKYRNNRFYDGSGSVYDGSNLSLLGSYPGVIGPLAGRCVLDVDPVNRRAFFLSGIFNYGVSFYNFTAYDRDLYKPLFQLSMPTIPGVPSRLLCCGTNFLAYVTSNGQLWFIRPEAPQPPRSPADLSLSASLSSPAPVLGVNYNFSITLSNSGPGTASLAVVSNALPPDAVLVQATPSTGSVASAAGAFSWTVGNLAPGSNAVLQLTVVFGDGGWQTNSTWALGFENDPFFANNSLTLPFNVQLSQSAYGVASFSLPVRDLLYDPVRDRLLLSVTNGIISGISNSLLVFNPYTGSTDSTTAVETGPAQLARSYDGQFLYVSLPDLGKVRQFNLPAMTSTYDTTLGGDNINGSFYPNYAKSLTAAPGIPNSFVAWRVRHAGSQASEYGNGIGFWTNGQMAPNLTASGGTWEPVFDTTTTNLFAYNAGLLEQCALNSNGVTVVATYPQITGGGADIEYGAGHFFTTGGELVDDAPFSVNWLFSGAQNAGAVVPDSSSSRVFYLVQNGNWRLQEYDIPTRRLLGSLAITNVSGTPGRLVRFGQDGLAFPTTGNQLFLVRSPMIRTDAFADLTVTVTGPATVVTVTSNAAFTVNLTNQGTIIATNIVVSNNIYSGGKPTSISTGAGTFTTNATGTLVVWSVPGLNPGAAASLSFSVQTTSTGLLSVISSATNSTFDPVPTNNTAVANVVVGQSLLPDGTVIVPLPANDVIWNDNLGQFIFSANAGIPNWVGNLFSIDPVSFTVSPRAVLGSDCNRLAQSADGTLLYAGTDFGGSMVALPSVSVTNHFLINPLAPGDYAYDIQVQPANNLVAAIGSKVNGNNGTWIAAYKSGAQLAGEDSFYSTLLSLQFGNTPSPLYVFNGAFDRYTVNSNGVALIDATSGLLPSGTALNMVFGNGLLYSSTGQVIDPSGPKSVGTISGIPAGSAVAFDSYSGRVFYLEPGGQTVLAAFDGVALSPAGSRVVPGITGSPTRFARWGTDGFVALTTGNQIVVFRSSLVPTNPPADVSISLAHSAPPFSQGSNVTAAIVISNAGPNTATSIVWSNSLPAGSILQSASVSLGTILTNSTSVSGTIASLAVGSTVSVNVGFVLSTSGIVTNQVVVTESAVDPVGTNNMAVALLWVRATNGVSNTLTLNLPLKDLEADRVRPMLYASFGANAGPLANSVVAIDPVNQLIGRPVAVGSNPNKLAASSDGQFLYVALDGSASVVKLSLPGLIAVTSFSLSQGQQAARMTVCPTNSDIVAIRRAPAGLTSVYNGGVKLPNDLSAQDLFAFLDTTGQLFGCDGSHSNVKLYQLNTASNGLSLQAAQAGKPSSSTNLISSGGLLFYNGGMIVNPASGRGVDLLPAGSTSVVAADAGCGRAFYTTGSLPSWTIRAFDIGQGIEVGSVSLPTLSSVPSKLLRWGADGLALYNASSQVVILSGQLVPTNQPIDLSAAQSVSALSTTTNQPITVSLLLSNSGPSTASGIIVTQLYSLAITNVSVTPSVGTASFTNGVMTWQPGSLTSNSTASLVLTGRPTQPGTLTISAFARHALNDVFWGNNAAVNVVSVANTNNVLAISLSARQLAYDPVRDFIYATTPASNQLTGNLVAVVDPATGALTKAFAAGSEPNQIALSDDSSFLHVSLDGAMGVQRFALASNVADLSFSLGSSDIFFAQDLITQPGNPNLVVASVASYNLASGYPSSVFAYDAGVARTNSGGPARGLAFSATGSIVYGQVAPGSSTGVEQMVLSPAGFATTLQPGFTSIPGNLKFGNGRLYSAAGQIIDPTCGILIGSFGVTGPQALDVNGGRSYFLTRSGTNWQISAFSLATLLSTGTQIVPGVQGTATNLIRCGQDRFAFVTTSGQLFIVHSPLVITNPPPPADLQISQSASQNLSATGTPLTFTVTVTNLGPGTASNVLIAINPPTPVTSLTLQVSQGGSTNTGNGYICGIGSLQAGSSAALTITASITNTAFYSNAVSVTSATFDPNASNNTSTLSVQGQYFQPANSTRVYGPTTTALAYDAARQRLLASTIVAGVSNTVAWYDPQSGVQLGSMAVGLTPDFMQITDDNHYAYLAASSQTFLQRIDLTTMTLDSTISLQAAWVFTICTLPGNPHSIAVTYSLNKTTGPTVTAIYDDAIPRSNVISNRTFGILTATADAAELYGYMNIGTGYPRVYRLSVSASGLAEVDHGPNDTPFVSTPQMIYGAGRLYFATGDVMSVPAYFSEQTFTFPGGVFNGTIVPLTNLGLLASATGDFNNSNLSHLGIFSISSRQALQQIDLAAPPKGGALTWCGADRFAYGTTRGIAFVRASTLPAADLSVSALFSTNQVMAGDAVTLQIAVSNAGPAIVTQAFVTNGLPAGYIVLSSSPSNFSYTISGSNVVFSLGTISTNTNATLQVSMALTNTMINSVTNLMNVTGTVTAVALDKPDPAPFNNSVSASVAMVPLDTNHDGIPDYWALQYGLNPLDSIADMDLAGDGITTSQKYFTGKNPFTFEGLKISSFSLSASNTLDLAIHGAVGQTYTLEESPNLIEWLPLCNFLCRSTNQGVSLPVNPAAQTRFYRVATTTNLPIPILALVNASAILTNPPMLQIDAPPGTHYSVFVSTNLADWSVLSNFYASKWQTMLTDSSAAGITNRFYRAAAQ